MRISLLVAVLALLVPGLASWAQAEERQVTLPSRPGVTESFLLTSPAGPPVASVILFTGGNGVVGTTKGNFLLRSRAKFAAAGFLVASADTPSDHRGGLSVAARTSADYARDIAVIVAYLRQQANVPVWFVGTSMGTISTAAVAANLKSGGPDGLVMTSSVTRLASGGLSSIYFGVDLASIRLPVLFVHNREDACVSSPFGGVQPLMDLFTRAARKELIAVSGGDPPRSKPCDARSRHGYLGLEDEVVGDIVRWIKG